MRILFYHEFLNACSYYRCLLPNKYLNSLPNIKSIAKEIISEEDISSSDIIIFQKKYSEADFKLLKFAKEKQKKVIYEVDDDLFNVPLWNPFFGSINRLRSRYKSFLQAANLITVTCEHLKQKLLPFNRRIQILPNYLDFETIQNTIPLSLSILNKHLKKVDWNIIKNQTKQKIKIGWAGSPTHKEDLKVVTDALINLCHVNPNVVIFMVLCADHKLVKYLPEDRIFFIEAVKLENYYSLLQELDLTFGLAPLSDHLFNRSKSNLKIIEYMAQGIIPIASAVENYTKTLQPQFNNLLIRPNNTKKWFEKLVELTSNQNLLELKEKVQLFAKENFNIANKINWWVQTFANLLDNGIRK